MREEVVLYWVRLRVGLTLGCPRFQLLLKVNGFRANMVLWSIVSPIVPFFNIWLALRRAHYHHSFETSLGAKKKSLQSPFILWSKRCASMRGFQIWYQNSKWITIDPLFIKKKKRWKIGIMPDFASSRQFFGQKGGQILSYLNLRPDLNPLIKVHLLDHKMKGDCKLHFLAMSRHILSRPVSCKPYKR